MPVRKILFLCTGNSCRSQIAEGLLRHWAPPGAVEVVSAGTDPKPVHPEAIRIMQEIGVDISTQRSKPLAEFSGQKFDWAITLCDEAQRACPAFPGAAQHLHWSIPDPAAAQGEEDERRAVFRAVRDELAARIQQWMKSVLDRPLGKTVS